MLFHMPVIARLILGIVMLQLSILMIPFFIVPEEVARAKAQLIFYANILSSFLSGHFFIRVAYRTYNLDVKAVAGAAKS